MKHVPFAAVWLLLSLLALSGAPAQAQPVGSHEDNIKRLEQVTGLKLDETSLEAERNASTKVRKKLDETRRSLLKDGTVKYAGGKPKFTVGYNKALEKKTRHLAGSQVPTGDEDKFDLRKKQTERLKIRDERFNAMLQTRGLLPQSSRQNATAECSPTAAEFNWRDVGKVSPVRNQGSCGSCWAFATAAALESSYLIRNNQSIKVSEQHLVSCSRSGSCDGGWPQLALDKLLGTGAADGTAYPYTGTSAVCELRKATPYHWSNWGLVAKSQRSIPKPVEIKKALCEHGPLITTVYVDDEFGSYKKGILNKIVDRSRGINHAVVIVGWDEAKNAWLIKNSWASDWGKLGGYAWVDYEAHNIGYATSWVQAHKDVELKDRCSSFDAELARVRQEVTADGQMSWVVKIGNKLIRNFGAVAAPGGRDDPNENDARLALTVLRHYKVDKDCSTATSAQDAPFRYWLVDGKPPVGSYRDEDCVDIEWQRLDVTKMGSDWVLSDGASQLEVFDGQRYAKSEDAAWLAYAYLKKHRMTKMCYFSRRDATLRYYRQ
jgi:cathepsin L